MGLLVYGAAISFILIKNGGSCYATHRQRAEKELLIDSIS